MDLLETSLLVKKTQYAPPDPMYATVRSKNAAAAVMFKELYKTPSPLIDPETGEPMEATPPNDFETENVVADAAMYDALGLGLSRGEMYGVMLAMKRLGEDPEKKLATVRFFGKMLGTTADYYVFESTLKEPAPAPEGETAEGEVPPEASGQGANTYTYFVCQTLGGPFTKLPDVTPATIRCARLIKRYLTGDLAADVSAYPAFPGLEADYLRAMIGRIASATVVCPAGMFTLDEETGAVNKVEEYAPGAAEDMVELDRWAHRYPHVKPQGRCEFYAAPVPEPEEGEEPAEEVEPETSPALLSTLDADAESDAIDWGAAVTAKNEEGEEVQEGRPAWASCTSSTVPGVKFPVIGIKSLVWPGAFVAYDASTGAFSNCYVGYGFKNAPFVPAPPPEIQNEFGFTPEPEPVEEGEEAPEPAEGEEVPEIPKESSELPPLPEPEPEPEEGEGEEGAEGEEPAE